MDSPSRRYYIRNQVKATAIATTAALSILFLARHFQFTVLASAPPMNSFIPHPKAASRRFQIITASHTETAFLLHLPWLTLYHHIALHHFLIILRPHGRLYYHRARSLLTVILWTTTLAVFLL